MLKYLKALSLAVISPSLSDLEKTLVKEKSFDKKDAKAAVKHYRIFSIFKASGIYIVPSAPATTALDVHSNMGKSYHKFTKVIGEEPAIKNSYDFYRYCCRDVFRQAAFKTNFIGFFFGFKLADANRTPVSKLESKYIPYDNEISVILR
ncbi:MAG: hypothetical protein CFH44_00655 [Proteobacteria bacterium]|nr:MAG: hypothetical protein CFH44_00655 [Pseudomonadota bacterium]